ncbi:MAG: hypothetical protein JRI66_04570 [Deltaproteobacteria bacterium]|nr:hypothetical protein [Deltaproteobacteria bacterium]
MPLTLALSPASGGEGIKDKITHLKVIGIIPTFMPVSWVPVVEFGLFVLVLLIRPNSLFGAKKMGMRANRLLVVGGDNLLLGFGHPGPPG